MLNVCFSAHPSIQYKALKRADALANLLIPYDLPGASPFYYIHIFETPKFQRFEISAVRPPP